MRAYWRWFAGGAARVFAYWRWFAGAAVLVFAWFVGWWSSGSDPLPKRWKPPLSVAGYELKAYESETPSNLYAALVNPHNLPECGKATPRPTASSISPQPHNWNCPHVSVYSVAAQLPPLTSLRDLTDRGQAEAIRFLEKTGAADGKTFGDIRAALNGSSPSGEKDPFRFDRVLVATVAKGASWKPSDRMMWTRIFVQPINFVFAGYQVAATDNETVKVTNVESTKTRKFDANIGSTIPGIEGPKATLGPSGEQTVKTASDINAQYEKLGIDISPAFLRIIRESETGGDVVGNTTISLTAITDPQQIRKRFPDDRLSSDPPKDDLVLLVTVLHADGDTNADEEHAPGSSGHSHSPFDVLPQVPVPHCPLLARVWMLYEERKVEEGNESYDESKQTVTLLQDAEDKEDVPIVTADEASPAVWSLQICDQKCDANNRTPLTATVKSIGGAQAGAPREVVFTDYGLAVRFAHWLRMTQQKEPPGSNYEFNYPRTDPGSHQTLRPFKKISNDCDGQGGSAD